MVMPSIRLLKQSMLLLVLASSGMVFQRRIVLGKKECKCVSTSEWGRMYVVEDPLLVLLALAISSAIGMEKDPDLAL